jgi:hypothetical protein
MEKKEKTKSTARKFLKLNFALANLELDITYSKSDKKRLAFLNKKFEMYNKLIKLTNKMNELPEKKDDDLLKYLNSFLIGIYKKMQNDVQEDIKYFSAKLSTQLKEFDIPEIPGVDSQR